MEEMLEDALQVDEEEEIEEEAGAEVDKVLFELTNGKLGQAGTVGEELPVSSAILLTWLSVDTKNWRPRKIGWRNKRWSRRWNSIGNSWMDY